MDAFKVFSFLLFNLISKSSYEVNKFGKWVTKAWRGQTDLSKIIQLVSGRTRLPDFLNRALTLSYTSRRGIMAQSRQ